MLRSSSYYVKPADSIEDTIDKQMVGALETYVNVSYREMHTQELTPEKVDKFYADFAEACSHCDKFEEC